MNNYFFFFFVLYLGVVCDARDVLRQGEALREGETLISENLVFELGFFSPNSSSAKYVGIWYYGLPNTDVIWVANRDQPISGPSPALTFSDDGNLVILSAVAYRVTNASSTASGNSTVRLLNTGNLVLTAGSGENPLWSWFDAPTDTFVAGMKLTADVRAGRSLLLRSWRTPADPSEGEFRAGLDPLGSGQVFIWRGPEMKPHWRSGQWNGRAFISIAVRPLSYYGFSLTYNEGGVMSLTFAEFNGSLFRFVLRSEGVLSVSQKVRGTGRWMTAFTFPGGDCEFYNRCGDNAVCGKGGVCECLRGFEAREGGGCRRRAELGCGGEESGFVEVGGVNLPDKSRWETNAAGKEACEMACRGNCSCWAFAYTSQIGCYLWFEPLVDLYELAGSTYSIHVRVAASDLPAEARDRRWIVVLCVSVAVGVVLLLLLGLSWYQRTRVKEWWRKSWKRGMRRPRLLSDRKTDTETGSNAVFEMDSPSGGKSAELPLFTFQCISKATADFSKENKLGEGGFGLVYKGKLPDGREVAVKRLSESSGQGGEEFKNEVRLIAKLQHRNLVRLLGCCVQGDEKIVIYEYLPNRSLDSFIFDPSAAPQLDWKMRFGIIEGIARGLLYLHRDSRLRIIHRDLKASNILLDEEMNPKISDFGMARIFGGNQNQANTLRVVGTFGYMSPEYAMEGLFSIKSDVYSFGVLMLEIISGQRNNSFRQDKSPNLVRRAWQLWNEDKSVELVDPCIRSSVSEREVTRCIQVGLLCVQDRASDRPTMASVLFLLGSDTIQPTPKQPTFTVDGDGDETDSIPQEFGESFSSRDITVSVVTGR
ncbi:G-type lectin S-receptor-like serine/threonine-protein kinase B120 [Wolffia australiana]